jgi:hypothetical protein
LVMDCGMSWTPGFSRVMVGGLADCLDGYGFRTLRPRTGPVLSLEAIGARKAAARHGGVIPNEGRQLIENA